MKQVSIPVKPENKLNIKATEDLSVQGTEQNILTAVVRQSDSFKYTEAVGKCEVKATSDCRLLIPATMIVTVERVGGDASISGLTGRVIVGKVGGDLVLQNLSGASVETVGGDLSLKNAGIALEIVRVGGDLFGTGVQSLSSRAVGGDVFLQQVSGDLNLVAGGDIEMEIKETEVPVISVKAGGDIRLVVPPEAKAQLEMHSNGGAISIHAGGQEGEWQQEEFTLPLGEGGNMVRLTAGGDITITDQDGINRDFEGVFDSSVDHWHYFGAELEKQIRESIGTATESMHWATQTANEAGEKARKKVEKAMRKMESKGVNINHTGVNVDRNGKQVDVTFGVPFQTKEKPKSGPSDEERLLVLKMLQEKKITAEEADNLLSALDK